MFEPPHWTKQPQAPIAKRSGEEQSGAPAKPEAGSLADLAQAIATIKDGMRAMAEQIAGLTARVDNLHAARDLVKVTKDSFSVKAGLLPTSPRASSCDLLDVAHQIMAALPPGWVARMNLAQDQEGITFGKGSYMFHISREEILDNIHLCLAVERAKHQDELAAAVERLSKLPAQGVGSPYQGATNAIYQGLGQTMPREPFTVKYSAGQQQEAQSVAWSTHQDPASFTPQPGGITYVPVNASPLPPLAADFKVTEYVATDTGMSAEQIREKLRAAGRKI